MQLNCALPGTDTKRFTNFDTHPWDAVPKEKRGSATAAGAYQIVYSTWIELLTGKNKDGVLNLNRKMFSLGSNEQKFTPIMQDRMAVALMELREALGYVRKGEIAKAVEKLNTEWTSLPGGAENAIRRTADKKPMNMGYFEELFGSYLEDEKKKWRSKRAFAEVYFFFAGAFFTSFLTGFLATNLTSGFYIYHQFVFIIC